MKNAWIVRLLLAAVVAAIVGWVVHNTAWVEVDVDDPARGLAATDRYYSLRRILEGTGSTLQVRSALEPLPPSGATLVLDSTLWNIFPERDARLKAWVESGGHLVVPGPQAMRGQELRWVPFSFAAPPQPPASVPARAAPVPKADDEDEDDDGVAPAAPPRQTAPGNAEDGTSLKRRFDPRRPWPNCTDFEETGATTAPAFEPGRVYRACSGTGPLRPLHVVPEWELTGPRGTLALRVPMGRGSVTGVSASPALGNQGLLLGDNALVAAAILQAAPGRPIWLVEDEAREPLLGWLWHEARTPFLLGIAAIALALWRLMVRFGPREAVPPQARRSMGEQVRGTGQFIAGTDPGALHAATRKAFEDVARTRIEGWAERGDPDRVAALAQVLAPVATLDKATLLSSLRIGSGATPLQILTAIAVIEHARRALLRAPPAPLAADTPAT